jgi:prepilin-type N-terminal cleavage/methylation domain-containing protein
MMKKIKKIIKTKNKQRGFTLLETLVAIFILVLSITGPMSFAQSSLRTAFLARDQITAFFLAQDAIETIKNMRDDNALKEKDWLDGIEICDENFTEDCLISIETLYENVSGGSLGDIKVEECSSGDCSAMKNDSLGRFGYTFAVGQSTDSRFTRNIYIKEIVANAELEIVVEVSWTSNVRVGGSRIAVQENIFNWIP